jgi:hypothetical protein
MEKHIIHCSRRIQCFREDTATNLKRLKHSQTPFSDAEVIPLQHKTSILIHISLIELHGASLRQPSVVANKIVPQLNHQFDEELKGPQHTSFRPNPS